ncbi:MAG: phage terminase large subunit [Chloroflexia bacterium]
MSSRVAILPITQVPAGRYYQPFGAARTMMHSRDTEIVIWGGAGTGKTRAHLEKLNLCAELYPRMRGLILRLERTTLTETALVTWEDEVLAPCQQVHPFGGRRVERYEYPNGSVVVVGGLDDPDSARKIMSGQYDRIHVIECTEIGEKAWMGLTSRLRNNRMPYQQIVGCCNPQPRSWVAKRAARGDCLFLESKHEDNPSITNQYREILLRLRGDVGRSLRDAEWDRKAGSVQRLPNLLSLPQGGDD